MPPSSLNIISISLIGLRSYAFDQKSFHLACISLILSLPPKIIEISSIDLLT